MNIKNALAALCAAVLLAGMTPAVGARTFDADFADSTIRLDYVLSGTPSQPSAGLWATHKLSGWAGRRHSLSRLPLAGNGRVTVTDPVSGDTLYVTSFSTLYNEWLAIGDTVARAFQATQLIPMPRAEADVELTICDNRNRPLVTHRHRLNPKDILIRQVKTPAYDTVMLHSGKNFDGNRIQVAILPEGFTAAEMAKFHDYARRTVKAILAHRPFGALADRFDFIAVDVPSADSGVSVPLQGQWRDTPFGSHFSTFYSDRYLTAPQVFAVHDALAGVPYEHIIILANTDTYGGGGIYNQYTLTTTGNPLFEPVVVHEFGHSFGGLADEYFYEDEDLMDGAYPADIEPWEPNITTLVNFDAKWKHLLRDDTPVPTPVERASEFPVGVYEGGGYKAKGIYRPADRCRMRVNDVDSFCPACIDALSRLIHFFTD